MSRCNEKEYPLSPSGSISLRYDRLNLHINFPALLCVAQTDKSIMVTGCELEETGKISGHSCDSSSRHDAL